MKMKSIIVATSIHPTFDKRIWKHCKAVARTGITVHLICPWRVPSGLGEEGVIFHPFTPARSMRERIFKVPRLIRKNIEALLPGPMALHIHDPDLLWLASSYRKRLATVYDCHEYFSEQVKLRTYVPALLKPLASAVVAKTERVLASRVGNVVLAAQGQVEQFQSPKINTLLVGNQASSDLLDEVSENWARRSSAIVFIGIQHEQNGSLIFLQVAELLARQYPSLRFIATDMFRNSTFREQYVNLIGKLGLSERVELHPPVVAHKIMDILNLGTVAISPNLRIASQMKANQTKLYEIMAAGLPIVASDLPHQKAMIEMCRSGLIAQPESPESFAKQIACLLDNPELRLQLGKSAQKAFRERYCYEMQIPALLDFYSNAYSDLNLKSKWYLPIAPRSK